MKYKLRPYQEDAVHAAINYFEVENRKGVIVAPTGAGKSLIIAEIAHRLCSPVLVLQPSKELLEQNYEKYVSYGNEASIYSASLKKKEIHREVTFGTIGSVKSNVEGFLMAGVKHIIIDECHLASKNSSATKTFIDALGVRKVIGLTATPIELKNNIATGSYLQIITRSRKNMFNDMVHITQIKDIINQGFWSDIIYEEASDVNLNYLKLNSSNSDFTMQSIQNYYSGNSIEGRIVSTIKHLIDEGRKSILVFVPTIDDSDTLAFRLNRFGINTASVHSNLSKAERNRIVQGFKDLSIRVVINVNVLSVGFDHPELDAIVMARPTNSFAIYYQQAGRGVRIHPKKENVKICDFSGNVSKFGELDDIEFTSVDGKMEMVNSDYILTGMTIKDKPKPKNDRSVHLWFGMYKGDHIKDVKLGYLEWMLENFDFSSHRELHSNIKKEVHRRLNSIPFA